MEGFVYRSQLQPAAWLNPDGSVRASFVYGGKPNVPEYMVQGVTYRLVTDQVGSVRLVVDATTGTIAERIDYDEYGTVVTDTAPGFQPFGYSGGLYDRDTGLVRFGFRDYEAVTGRWTTKDPLLFGGADMNLYASVSGDPINQIDPDGLKVRRRHVHHRKGPRRKGKPDGLMSFVARVPRQRVPVCKQRRSGRYGYDVNVDLDLTISYRLGVAPTGRSADEDGYTLEEHERHHSDDFEFGRSDVADPTEGFDTPGACAASAASCADAVYDYFGNLEAASHTRDRQ